MIDVSHTNYNSTCKLVVINTSCGNYYSTGCFFI